MRITVTRTGGFAGLTRRAELTVEDRPDAPELRELARAALADGCGPPGPGTPDGFRYEITVDGRSVRRAESALSGAQRRLVRAVLSGGG